MKKILTSLSITLLLASCGNADKKASAEEESAPTPAAQLISRLDSAVNAGQFFFGHHDDTAYGIDWRYEPGNSDVKRVTGSYPGLMNWDLGMLELDSSKNLDGVPFSFMVEEIKAQNARGGINAISWHPRNPATGGTSWDTSEAPLKVIANDTVMSATLDSWIAKAATFISSLTDENGNRIPVVFRPWHENSGDWFWWGAAYATPEQYIDLWKRTRRIFDEKGVDNVVWAYSPDKGLTLDEYLVTYPGDEYVDILGTDIYHFKGEEGLDTYRNQVGRQLSVIAAEAKKRGKVAAFTETGSESVPMDRWFTEVLLPAIDTIPLAYVCVWRNAHNEDKAGHFYVPYPEHPAAEDFKAFHDHPKTIFVK